MIGLLLGTALAVIIPEGVHLYYHGAHGESAGGHEHGVEELNHSHEPSHGAELSEESLIGIALVAGFVFMLLVDNLRVCGGHGHSHAGRGDRRGRYGQGEDEDTELLELSRSESERLEDLSRSGAQLDHRPNSAMQLSKSRTTVTLGLIVHSLVDGMAVGVAKASAAKSSVQAVVFLAIMMHKVPAAFGLSIYLKSSGLGASAIRKNLALFSIAAPVGAVAWFLLLNEKFLNLASISVTATSLCMLFSAGTFLYVSTIHILSDIRGGTTTEGLTPGEVAAICSGSVVPILLSAGHHH